jgi:hypothetical protein
VLTAMTLPGPIASLIWFFKGVEARNRSLEEISREVENHGDGQPQ